MSDPCLIVPLLTNLVPSTVFHATTTKTDPNTSRTMNLSQQANTAAVAPNRGGCDYKGGCEPKKSKSLRQLIDERLSQSQKKAMSVATSPTPTMIAPAKTTKTDSSMAIPHPPAAKPVVSKSKKSARMQRRSSSAQIQRRQHAQQRHASPSQSCSSSSVTSYSYQVVATNDHHSHSAATVCSSSSVSSCSIGTSIRVLAGNKRQEKENMKNKPASEHRQLATSRVGKHLSIPTTAALQSSFSPAVTVKSVSVPIATAVAQSRNQNHLMSRYSTSPQKQRPQRRQPYQDHHDEKGQAQERKEDHSEAMLSLPAEEKTVVLRRQKEAATEISTRVFFDFEDNKIIPNPTTTTTNIPRSHIKKPLTQDLSLKKKQDVLTKNTKSNTSQSPSLKSQQKLEADSPAKNNTSKDIASCESNDNKNKISNNENKSMDNENNSNMSQGGGGGGGGRLSTPLARSRRFQSWCDSRKQKQAAYYSSGASLNHPDEE